MANRRGDMIARLFEDMVPTGFMLHNRPDLPTVMFKRDKIKYTVTDFRLLNPCGTRVFVECLNTMLHDEGTREIQFDIPADVDDNTIQVIEDIVNGFTYTAKGRGYEQSGSVVAGTSLVKNSDGTRTLTVCFIEDFARHTYEYGQAHKGGKITLEEIIVYDRQKREEEFRGWVEEQQRQGTL